MNMYNLIDYHIPEAIQIHVTKQNNDSDLNGFICLESASSNKKNICHFCVDPQITSLSILQALLVRAFNLHCDFYLYYLDWNNSKWLPINTDSDLSHAYLIASRPHLNIKMDIIHYPQVIACESNGTKTSDAASTVLAEWDVVTSSDVILAQTFTKTNNFIFQQIEKIKNKAKSISNNTNSWYLAETIFQYIMNTSEDRQEPIDDVSLREFLDQEGRVKCQRKLRIGIYRRGIDCSLRKVIWKHLLNVYPEGYTGQERIDFVRVRCETYRQMRELWQRNVTTDSEVINLANMIRKDVRRTDRHHPFYANTDDSEEDNNPNVTSLYNILMTYALNHQHRYCQGMSDLASPILYVMKDEAHAYISFCALMNRLAENFSVDGNAISRKFRHLTKLLQQYDPEFYQYLRFNGAHELLYCYRWILLDLKREFSFDDTLKMLEVLWASIPPTTSTSAHLNLFDLDYLYTSNFNSEQSSIDSKTKCLSKDEIINPLALQSANTISSKHCKPTNHQIRSIKFLPNVLSSDSQVLESPTLSECSDTDETGKNKPSFCEKSIGPKPWDSPNMPRKACFEFNTKPNVQKLYFSSVEYEDEKHTPEFEITNDDVFDSITSSIKSQQSEDTKSSSTWDSGIHKSNTITLTFQDDYNGSTNSNQFESSEEANKNTAANRRKRFHCLNGLRNAHCNGDDLSDEENCCESIMDYEVNSAKMIHFECPESNRKSQSRPENLVENMRKANSAGLKCLKSSNQLTNAKKLLTFGRSSSVDSLNCSTDNAFEKNKEDLKDFSSFQAQKIRIESNVLHNLINDEFNHLSARSVSEEMLNNTIIQMESLSVIEQQLSGSDGSNSANQSSNSSLVIIPTHSELTNSDENLIKDDTLLSPETLGADDAFMLFLCLTLLLQNRNHIMEQKMDRNDIQMFFDNMVRKHNVQNVLDDARHLFHTYLSQWHKESLHKDT